MRLRDGLGAPETRQAMLFAVGVWAAAVPVFLSPGLASLHVVPGGLPLHSLPTYVACSVIGMLLSVPVIGVARASEVLPRWCRLAFVITAVTVVGVVHGAVDVLLQELLASLSGVPVGGPRIVGSDGRPVRPPFHFLVALNFLTLVWMHGVVAALAAVSRFHWIIRRQQQAMAAASEAKLDALRFQLNPHFLFNTLNVLSALIVTSENDRAERLLRQLSEFLRTTLSGPDGLVGLGEELALMQTYLDIEATRAGPRFIGEVICPATLAAAPVPPMILLPLVERAVAGAVCSSRPVVRVAAAVSAGHGRPMLTIDVRGSGGADRKSLRVRSLDLPALRERIASHYGSGGALSVEESAGGFKARLVLPRQPEKKGSGE